MLIEKTQVIDILRSLGKDTGPAQSRVPEQVDTDEHSDLLDQVGISRGELLEQFGGSPDEAADGYSRADGGDAAEDDGQDVNLTHGVAGSIVGLRGIGLMGGTGN